MAGKKAPIGRPSKYDPSFDRVAYQLTLLGGIDRDIAAALGVTEQTVNNWKKAHPSFFESLNDGKSHADGQVAARLFERATGYSHDEEKIFCNAAGEVTRVATVKHYPPDSTAAIFWLKNRRPDLWRDRHEVTGEDGGPLGILVVPKRDPAPEPE